MIYTVYFQPFSTPINEIVPQEFKQYEVLDTNSMQLHVFNKESLHRFTKNILTGSYIYNFTHSNNLCHGKLKSVVDEFGNSVTIGRDYRNLPNELVVSTTGKKLQFHLNPSTQIVSIVQTYQNKNKNEKLNKNAMTNINTDNINNYKSVTFSYFGNAELISSVNQSDGKRSKIDQYRYDDLGRIKALTNHDNPSLNLLQLENAIQVENLNGVPMKISSEHQFRARITNTPDDKHVAEYPTLGVVAMVTTQPWPVLNFDLPISVTKKTTLTSNNKNTNLMHVLEWFYYQKRPATTTTATNNQIKRRLFSSRDEAMNSDGRSHEYIGDEDDDDDDDDDNYDYPGRIMEQNFYHPSQPLNQQQGPQKLSSSFGYMGKMLSVNGQQVLFIEFNRTTYSDVIMNKNGEELFTVRYDKAGRVVQADTNNHHVQKLIPALTKNYNHNGHLVSEKIGGKNVAYEYTEKGGKLAQVKIGGNVKWKYSYAGGDGDELLTSRTSARGSTYRYEYDSSDRLTTISLPDKTTTHTFHVRRVLGQSAIIYTPPGFHHKHAIRLHVDVSGNINSLSYANSNKIVRYRYANTIRLMKLSRPALMSRKDHMQLLLTFDETSILYTRNDQSTLMNGYYLESLQPNSSSSTTQPKTSTDYYHSYIKLDVGSMLCRWQINEFDFTRNNNNSDNNNDITKHIKRWEQFATKRSIKFPGAAEFVTSWEDNGDSKSEWLSLTSESYIFESVSRYDDMGRLQQWQQKLGLGDKLVTYLYLYNEDDRVTEVTVNGRSTWRYFYDQNGAITEVSHFAQKRALVRELDETGFVRSLNDKYLLEHNSMSQLVAIRNYSSDAKKETDKQSDVPLVSVLYDSKQRLVMLKYRNDDDDDDDGGGDDDGGDRIFACQNGDDMFYIMTDLFGSPLAATNHVGDLIYRIIYDPLGNIVEENKKSSFPMHFGFNGGVREPQTGLVYMRGGRWFDSYNGRYTALLDANHLHSLHRHQHRYHHLSTDKMFIDAKFLNPFALHIGAWKIGKIKSSGKIPAVLQSLRYKLNHLMPYTSLFGDVSIRQPMNDEATSSWHRELSNLAQLLVCSYEKEFVARFRRFSSMVRSALSALNLDDEEGEGMGCEVPTTLLFESMSTSNSLPDDLTFTFLPSGEVVFQHSSSSSSAVGSLSSHSFSYLFAQLFNKSKIDFERLAGDYTDDDDDVNDDDDVGTLKLYFVKRVSEEEMKSETYSLEFDQTMSNNGYLITKYLQNADRKKENNDVIVKVDSDKFRIQLRYLVKY
ncbi:hypothetical protein HELRODRAFT_192323 [Helobdella robusta]|uniref:Teneurin-like YD-shell domain-containing protein n=1 Tax=Helobdella robusta TaxID=6412 RepID=T1FTT9_HELRO|nr:hypothetical protein HELRODRAFT_192323 [Helobdella robusta]ESO01394.1 hypothetical protein HELRODRAFT_192323 [Helobdella robusta]